MLSGGERSLPRPGPDVRGRADDPTKTVSYSTRLKLSFHVKQYNQSCYALVAITPINQYYLYFAMLEGVVHLRNRAVGAVFDAIIRDTFRYIPFLVPDMKLLAMFTEHVMPIMKSIANITTQIRKLEVARDLLLPRLMNGELIK